MFFELAYASKANKSQYYTVYQLILKQLPMDTKELLAGMYSEHANWQKQILSYREELNSLNSNLEEYVQKVPPREISPSVEHFQNQFIRQNEVLDIMRHDFKQYENRIEDAQSGSVVSTENLEKERAECTERLGDYDKIFSELKNEFSKFNTGELLHS